VNVLSMRYARARATESINAVKPVKMSLNADWIHARFYFTGISTTQIIIYRIRGLYVPASVVSSPSNRTINLAM